MTIIPAQPSFRSEPDVSAAVLKNIITLMRRDDVTDGRIAEQMLLRIQVHMQAENDYDRSNKSQKDSLKPKIDNFYRNTADYFY
jgi:hypothetical protein